MNRVLYFRVVFHNSVRFLTASYFSEVVLVQPSVKISTVLLIHKRQWFMENIFIVKIQTNVVNQRKLT